MKKSDLANGNRLCGLKYCLRLFTLTSILFSCTPRQPERKVPIPLIPDHWRPSLVQVQDNLQEAHERNPNKSQQALNRASQDLADLLDARLFIAYVGLMESLDQAARSELFNEQKNWLAKRIDIAQAAITSKGGSLGPLEYSGAYRKITAERLAQLEERLTQQTAK